LLNWHFIRIQALSLAHVNHATTIPEQNFSVIGPPSKYRPEAVSVHQNLQGPKIDRSVFWVENLCIVFDAHSPVSSTGIDQIKQLSIIFIHIIFIIFLLPPPNTRFLQGEAFPSTKLRVATLIGTRRSCSLRPSAVGLSRKGNVPGRCLLPRLARWRVQSDGSESSEYLNTTTVKARLFPSDPDTQLCGNDRFAARTCDFHRPLPTDALPASSAHATIQNICTACARIRDK
jgi:hypothetical protein